jgi:hypothetical protein
MLKQLSFSRSWLVTAASAYIASEQPFSELKTKSDQAFVGS